eukprot:UN28868
MLRRCLHDIEGFHDCSIQRRYSTCDLNASVGILKSMFEKSVDIRIWPPKDGKVEAIMAYSNIENALKDIDCWDGKKCDIGYGFWHVALDIEVRMVYPSTVFRRLEKDVQTLIMKVLKKKYTSLKVYFFTKPRGITMIKIWTEKPEAAIETRSVIQEMFTPERIQLPHADCLNLCRDVISVKRPNIYISFLESKGEILIYGPKVLRVSKKQEIEKLCVFKHATVNLKNAKRLIRSTKTIAKEFGCVIAIGDNIVQFWSMKDVSLAIDMVKKLHDNLPDIRKEGEKIKQDDDSMCGICFTGFDDGESLDTLDCKHKFHSECLQYQIKSSLTRTGTRPLKCACCGINVTLTELKKVAQRPTT